MGEERASPGVGHHSVGEQPQSLWLDISMASSDRPPSSLSWHTLQVFRFHQNAMDHIAHCLLVVLAGSEHLWCCGAHGLTSQLMALLSFPYIYVLGTEFGISGKVGNMLCSVPK